MMQRLAITCVLSFLVSESAAVVAIFGTNSTLLRGNCQQRSEGTSYGDNRCRCVGVDNLKGYYAAQVKFHHVQYKAETGASCEAWDKSTHPECKGSVPPQWCSQEWCYVDPCSCDLEVPPTPTKTGVEYQGGPAFWSYRTCGGTDFFSQEEKHACVNQKSEGDCAKNPDCGWDGRKCAGAEVVKTCTEAANKDESVYGEEDCRCIGLGGKDVGKAFMNINDQDQVSYSPNVGATCDAWDGSTHPDCLKGGKKPPWCSAKWCFVDPCKCKAKVPPKAVQSANKAMRFQGKTAYWSYDTCGSKDSWSTSHAGSYCITQKSEAECSKMSTCAWDGKQCLGKALVEICAKQEATGVLGVESPLGSSSPGSSPLKALFVVFVAAAVPQFQ